MITLHAAAKKASGGFVPMITLRGAKGQMMGARCPQGAYREFRTYTNEVDALSEARLIVCRMAKLFPGILQAQPFHA